MMAIQIAGESEGRTLTLEGDRSAGAAWFHTLSDRELDRGYRLAGFILGDGREAEDATQDALARAWDRRATLRNLDSAQAWFTDPVRTYAAPIENAAARAAGVDNPPAAPTRKGST